MKRRYIHWVFAVTSVALVSALGAQVLQLYRHLQLSTALESIPDSLDTLEGISISEAMYHHPEVRLRLASALANGGNLEEAEGIFNTLARDETDEKLNTGAQYNLANAYLRQALVDGVQLSSQSLPMVELAKQRYRDLLHDTPMYWAARYNLERALLLAPEGSDRALSDRIEPVKSVNVVVPGFEKQDLP